VEVGAQEQVARLLREANVYRIRQQWDLAEAKCREALALMPEDAGTIEMIADLLRAQDKLPEASDQYRRAMALAPERTIVEKKYAEVALELAERKRLRDLAQLALENPQALRQPRKKRNVTMALFSSLLFPGLGQFYNAGGFDLKGAILAGVALLCLLLGLKGLVALALGSMGARVPVGESGSAAFGLLLVIVWVYAIGDAVAQAGKSSGSSTDDLGF
jgi:tetratricopeptide (TPR) repeat protein